jgi:protease-4
MAAESNSKTSEAETAEKNIRLALFPIRGSFPETSAQAGLFGDLETTLNGLIDRLTKAAKDKKIAGIILKIRGPAIGRGKVDELRGAIFRARKAGKKVYADVEMATATDYLIACACDEIVMPPAGSLLVTGVRVEVNFYKGLLDKIGAKAEILQVGDFKGAGEPYTRAEMSPELKKQYRSIVDDLYAQLVTHIATGRNMEPQRVRELLDSGLFMAEDAKNAGLIDRVAYENELKTAIQLEHQAQKLTIIKNYGKKKIDTDFSGFAGMMKLMNLLMKSSSDTSHGNDDQIALVYAVGAIMTGEGKAGLLGGKIVGADTVIKALQKAENEERVKAIVLRVDSPGGSALASDLIWHQVRQCKKPVISSMGDVAASGGYYICMGADRIFAQAGTLTGSIGVIGGKIAVGNSFQKLGITTDVVSRGKNSGVFSILTPFTPAEKDVLWKMMREIYRQFTSKAAESRKMELKDLQALAEGKIYTGKQAEQIGLVDDVGTLHDAITAAKKAAGLAEDQKVDLLILPETKSLFEELFSGQIIDTRIQINGLENLAQQWTAPLAEVEILQQLFRQPVQTMLPYRIKIR